MKNKFQSWNAATVLKPHFFLINLIFSLLGSGITSPQNHEPRYSKHKIFKIMADESADISNEEQLVLCFRWIDDDFEIHEDFIALHPLPNTKADSIVKVILNFIQRMGLKQRWI